MEDTLTKRACIPPPKNDRTDTLESTPKLHSIKHIHSTLPVASVDTMKQLIKHVLKNTGRNDEPSEQEINQAMNEFHEMNKVPQWRHN